MQIEVQQPERSRQNSLIDIDISPAALEKDFTHAATEIHLMETEVPTRRGSILKIIETDDET